MRLGEAAQVEKKSSALFSATIWSSSMPLRAFLSASKALPTPRSKAQSDRRTVHPRVRIRRARPGRVRVFSPGHHLPPRRHRIPGRGRQFSAHQSHHNVGGLPKDMQFKLVEPPLRQLFKDEVRQIGLELGIAPELVWRQPFPGPGLAVRCLGEVTPPAALPRCNLPMPSSWKNSARQTCSPGTKATTPTPAVHRLLLCSCPCDPWA